MLNGEAVETTRKMEVWLLLSSALAGVEVVGVESLGSFLALVDVEALDSFLALAGMALVGVEGLGAVAGAEATAATPGTRASEPRH